MRKTKQIRSAVVCCCLCVCVCVHLFIYFRVEKQTRHGRHMNNVEKTLKVKKTQSIYSQEQQPAASSRYYHGYIGNRFPLFLFFLKSRVLQSHAGCVCVCVVTAWCECTFLTRCESSFITCITQCSILPGFFFTPGHNAWKYTTQISPGSRST